MAAKRKLVKIDVVALGRAGGKARAANLSPTQRKEIAGKAAAARWGNLKKATGRAIDGVPTEAESSPSKALRRQSWQEYSKDLPW